MASQLFISDSLGIRFVSCNFSLMMEIDEFKEASEIFDDDDDMRVDVYDY